MRALFAVLLLGSAAHAAEVTDLPPALRGDIHLGYLGSLEQVGLQESDAFVFSGSEIEFGDATYGIRNTLRHTMDLRLEFSPFDGIVVLVGLPINIQQTLAYPAAREMVFDPVTGEGSYERGQPISPSPVVSGGLRGAWLGLAFSPFHETFDKGLPVSTRFTLAARTPGAKSSLYGPNRGDGAGAALRLGGAFSVRKGKGEPWLTVDYVREFPFTVPQVVNNDGAVLGSEEAAKLPDRLELAAGVEAIVMENPEKDLRVAIDVGMAFGYRGPGKVISGFWLPDVLPSTLGASVDSGDGFHIGGRLALDVHMNKWVGLRLGTEAGWLSPRRIESPYAVRTDFSSYRVGWTLDLVGRVRLKSD